MNYREITKFLSGLIMGDFLVGVWLYMAGNDPINFIGIRISREVVPYWMLLDLVVFVFLVRFAWLSKSSKKKK